jgi:hypothetical protein
MTRTSARLWIIWHIRIDARESDGSHALAAPSAKWNSVAHKQFSIATTPVNEHASPRCPKLAPQLTNATRVETAKY